jgi:8-oxo-dGTP diphosphatase
VRHPECHVVDTVVVDSEFGAVDALLYVVRHAQAGARSDRPDDHLRPLSACGRIQARWLAGLLEFVQLGDVLSSPYVRCVETVEPLAARHDRRLTVADALAEGAPIEPLLKLLEHLPIHSVVCTHGDMLHGIVDAIESADLADREIGCFDKGVVWVLARTDGGLSVVDVIPPHTVTELALVGGPRLSTPSPDSEMVKRLCLPADQR